MTNYFTAVGPWTSWSHSLKNKPLQWGIRDDSQNSNLAIYDLLKIDDIVFFKVSQKHSKKFSKNGIFGIGKVTRKFHDAKSRFWPDEKAENKVQYPHRFEMQPLKIVDSDKELLPWITGLPFTKGLNHIVQTNLLKSLIVSCNTKWKLELKYIPPKFPLEINGFYDKENIRKKLKISPYGGIRISKAGFIVLFSNVPDTTKTKDKFSNVYHDFVDPKTNLIHYMGQGQDGDQKLTVGNLAVYNAKKDFKPIHYFRQYDSGGNHEYLGPVEVVKTTTKTHNFDGVKRKVFVFLLKPTSVNQIIDESASQREEEFEFISAKKQNKTPAQLEDEIQELNKQIIKMGPKKGKVVQRKEKIEEKRNLKMVTKMKILFKDKCQICKTPHFETKNGYYCEVHHLIPWSESHDDTKENLVVVCPTCHKKFDHAKDEIKKTMYEKLCRDYSKIKFKNPF